MRSINKVILVGNLTRDPEMRQTPNGQTVTTFGLATNREWMTKEGEKKNSAEFHECVAWARLAEICHKYIKKGKLVYVEGYLKTRSWDTPEGVKKFKTEVVVQDMIMLEKKGSEGEDYLPEDAMSMTEEFGDEFGEEETPMLEETPASASEASTSEASTEAEPTPVEETPAEDTSEATTPTEENPIDKDLGL